jgi:hypothetical protein
VQTTGAILLLRLFKIIPPIVLILITIVRIPVFSPKKSGIGESGKPGNGKSGNGDDLGADDEIVVGDGLDPVNEIYLYKNN